MAIAEMRKMRLIGLKTEQDAILNALAETGAVQIAALTSECEDEAAREARDAFREQAETRAEELAARAAELDDAAEYAEDAIKKAEKGEKRAEPLPAYRDLAYAEFLDLAAQSDRASETASAVRRARTERAELEAERGRIAASLARLAPYLPFDGKFSDAAKGKRVRYALGTVPEKGLAAAADREREAGFALASETFGATPQGARAVLVAFPAARKDAALAALGEAGFSACPFSGDETPLEVRTRLEARKKEIDAREKEIESELLALKPEIPLLRSYADYVRFLLEKAEAERAFGATGRTFELEAFLPAEAEENVKAAAGRFCVYTEVRGVTEADRPPTLIKNPAPVKQFEFVTNMYSPPRYGELDPNPVTSVFFLLFFGFIMADVGYGLLLAIGAGALAYRKKRDSESRRLLWVLSMGGVATVLFGFLFGSFFGFTHDEWSVIPRSVMPDPQAESQKLLVWCLIAGALQIFVAFLMKGVACIRDKRPLDAVFDGFLWSVFFAGAIVAALGMFRGTLGLALPSDLLLVGGIVAGSVIAIEIFAAGRHAKGFGKFTKGFGAVYGVIDFFSDILSYARLFGLMLSGAIIANIVTDLSTGMMHGAVGTIAGAIIFLIGHAFNLAMGALGAYIHDSRLQYIEFFKRFYEGEGELFRPLASSLGYVNLKK